MAKCILLLLFINFVSIALTFEFNGFRKSIHIAQRLREKDLPGQTVKVALKAKDVTEKGVPHFLQKAVDEMHESRERRAVDKDRLKPQSSSFAFNDSHSQMVIHWAGKNSDVIIALTKGSVVGSAFSFHARHTSNVFVSHNYGRNFTSLNDKLRLYNGTQAVISQFFNAPSLNSHYIFADENSRFIFTTRDYGRTIFKKMVPFKPTKILFHKSYYSLVLGMDDSSTGDGMLYLSKNFGESWQGIKSNVRTFYWDDGKYAKNGTNSTCIYILRLTTADLGTVIRSCDFFENDEVELLTFVHDFEIQGPYMFATRKLRLLGGTGTAHQIYVSYYRGRFYNSQFPHDLTHLDYYVADASEDQIFMCVNHDELTTHLYISNVNGTKFSQSLENILYFNPNGSNRNSWLRFYMDKPFADLHKVAGMRGVYIATQLINKTLSSDHQRSLISYDKGGEWQLIVAPERDFYNNPTNCSVETNCSLHVSQKFHRLYASSRATPILSKASAPGLILATGNYGSKITVGESAGVFLSGDAGFTWHQVLDGVHYFALADHGGIILAVKQYEPTNQIVYSTDEGETWHVYNFTRNAIRIHGVLTEPGEKTTVFFLFGSNLDHHSWIVISLNLSTVFSKLYNTEFKFRYLMKKTKNSAVCEPLTLMI
ncbi:sortilin-related receptor-like isoform X2 [Mercenaria mercenaria]|uniref:sortilin-related receptor-like isoform X2 n=1 Tax=Mercenaria mercenaria TaxID=6596 RepID=UPI00234F0D16|nr:sortilin-related receptor-like isoform X2 [Mercenaria mercenaria]